MVVRVGQAVEVDVFAFHRMEDRLQIVEWAKNTVVGDQQSTDSGAVLLQQLDPRLVGPEVVADVLSNADGVADPGQGCHARIRDGLAGGHQKHLVATPLELLQVVEHVALHPIVRIKVGEDAVFGRSGGCLARKPGGEDLHIL